MDKALIIRTYNDCFTAKGATTHNVMTISDLIEVLKEYENQYGNIPVLSQDDGMYGVFYKDRYFFNGWNDVEHFRIKEMEEE